MLRGYDGQERLGGLLEVARDHVPVVLVQGRVEPGEPTHTVPVKNGCGSGVTFRSRTRQALRPTGYDPASTNWPAGWTPSGGP